MSAVKILKKQIPEIRSGNCAEDPSISDNHAQVMQHMCVQMELMVNGVNDYMAQMDQSVERMINQVGSFGKDVASLRADVARWHEEFALTAKDLTHLSQDVDRMGDKVRRMDDRRWDELTIEEKDQRDRRQADKMAGSADRRAILGPVWMWVIAGVVGLMVLGFGSYIKETAQIENQAVIKQLIVDELEKAVK